MLARQVLSWRGEKVKSAELAGGKARERLVEVTFGRYRAVVVRVRSKKNGTNAMTL